MNFLKLFYVSYRFLAHTHTHTRIRGERHIHTRRISIVWDKGQPNLLWIWTLLFIQTFYYTLTHSLSLFFFFFLLFYAIKMFYCIWLMDLCSLQRWIRTRFYHFHRLFPIYGLHSKQEWPIHSIINILRTNGASCKCHRSMRVATFQLIQ